MASGDDALEFARMTLRKAADEGLRYVVLPLAGNAATLTMFLNALLLDEEGWELAGMAGPDRDGDAFLAFRYRAT